MCVFNCQSINGVAVNGKSLSPGKWTTLVFGDTICFGANVDRNELKYALVQGKNEQCCLRRCGLCVDEPQLSPPRKKARMSDEGGDPADLTQGISYAPHLVQLQPEGSPCATAVPCCGTRPSGSGNPVPLRQSDPEDPVPLPANPISVGATHAAASSSNAVQPKSDKSGEVIGTVVAPSVPLPHEQLLRLSPPLPSLAVTVAQECGPKRSEPSDAQRDQEKEELLLKIAELKEQLEMKESSKVAPPDQDDDSNPHDNSVITSMEEEFTCCICQELFIRAHTLSCAHSFCELCIKEWMKTKMECPICRKAFSLQPVHSLALDNAITKIVDKLGSERKAAREVLVAARTKPSCPPTSLTEKATTSHSLRTHGTREAPITIEADETGVIHIGEEEEGLSLSGDSDSEDDYEEGFAGAYYGGYGRCYHCGRHWWFCTVYLNHWNPFFPPYREKRTLV